MENMGDEEKYLKDLLLRVCENGHLSAESSFSVSELYNADYPYLGKSKVTILRRDNLVNMLEVSLNAVKIGQVVDIGCGNLELLELLRDSELDISGQLTGIDPVPRTEIPQGVKFKNSFFDPELVPIKSDELPTLAVLDNVLEHIQELRNFISQISQWLRDEDYILICVPSYEAMVKNEQFEEITHEHSNYFTLSSLIALFVEFGFENLEAYSEIIDSRGYNFHLFKKISEKQERRQLEGSLHQGKFKSHSNRLALKERELLIEDGFFISLNNFQLRLVNSYPGGFTENFYGVGASELTPILAYYMNDDFGKLQTIFDSTPSKTGKFMPGIKARISPWETLENLGRDANLFICAPSVSRQIATNLKNKGFKNIWLPKVN